jgi:hypothetical protein
MKERSGDSSTSEKVAFRLTPDEDGFPPADWEHLWADAVGGDQFRLDNTPFFARDVSCGDIVKAVREGELNVFQEVVRSGGHGTVRVILNPDSALDFVSRMSDMGCQVEVSHIPGYIAIDVPPSVRKADLLRYLDHGEAAGLWEYEVSAWAA